MEKMFTRIYIGLCLLFSGLAQPAIAQVDFNADVTEGCGPLLVNFTDLTPNAVKWQWDFGNGTTSTIKNPGLIYSEEGIFTVGLTVTYPDGSTENFTKSGFINVTLKPQIDAKILSKVVCAGEPVTFGVEYLSDSTLASQDLTRLIWDFGDGTTAEGLTVNHVYEQDGLYTITLLAENTTGCVNVINNPDFVAVTPKPDAGFTFDNGFSCFAPAKVGFNSNQGGGSHLWDFGDGAFSPLVNPSHTFNKLGSYTVIHYYTNPNGCRDTSVVEDAINLGQGVLKISTNSDIICAGAPVDFFSNIANSATYSWDFGDGIGTSTQDTAIYTYATPGTYEIALTVTDATGCASNITKTIVVTSPLTVDFTALDTSGCEAPISIDFQNNTTGAIAFQWEFGDGTTSILANPVHTYTAEGSYTVSLLAINPDGCKDSLVLDDFIQVQQPVANFSVSDSAGCAPFTVTFTDESSSGSAIANYFWDFGDGQTSTEANPTITFANPGTYDVRLSVENADGCSHEVTLPNAVVVGENLTADFTVDANSNCLGDSVAFTNTSLGTFSQCLWDFGDGNTSEECSPTHKYTQSGKFDVRLKVIDRGCENTVIQPEAVERLLPRANFTADPQEACGSPATINFTDGSEGVETWNWDFGDGTISTEPNPTYTYNTEGIATVSLEVTSSVTGCYDRYQLPISILPAKANFSVDAKTGCIPFRTRFRDNSSNAIEWFWDFGDGNTSTVKSPQHTYFVPGEYDITLIITTAGGCKDTIVKQNHIRVGGVILDYTTQDSLGCGPHEVNFQSNIVATDLASLKWDFGDGNEVSGIENPVHLYDSAGVFNVRVSARDALGCVTIIQQDSMVEVRQPVAAFNTNFGDNCLSTEVQFENNSSGVNLSYLWDFGDGNTSTDENPIHTYGVIDSYPVRLTVTDDLGCDSTSLIDNFVSIGEYTIDFFADTTSIDCPPLLASFFPDSTLNDLVSWYWDFGDGTFSTQEFPVHIYALPGKYDVSLIGVNQSGCTDTVIKEDFIVIEGPSASFTIEPLEACPGEQISFEATAIGDISIQWDFGDGLISDELNIEHVYESSGIYRPRILIKNSTGCEVLVENPDSVTIATVPEVIIGSDISIVCQGEEVAFQDNSTLQNLIAARRWSFGDGSGSSEENPRHIYGEDGRFDIGLEIQTTQGCQVTGSESGFIRSIVPPEVDILISDDEGCSPLSVGFEPQVSISPDSIASWNWDFGDQNGTANSAANQSYTYQFDGLFRPGLTITDRYGCSDSTSVLVNVLASPISEFFADSLRGCAPHQVSFTNQSANGDMYQWSYGDSTLFSNEINPSVLFEEDGLYDISLIAISENGCSDTLQKDQYIKLTSPIADFNTSDTVVCPGTPITFQDLSIADTNIVNWEWNLGDEIVNGGSELEFSYTDRGIKNVSLAVTNIVGCSDTIVKSRLIEVLSDSIPSPLVVEEVSVVNTQAVHLQFQSYKGDDFSAYNIYRFDSNGSSLIHSTDDKGISFFRDTNIFPEDESYCYQIQIENQCGIVQDLVNLPLHCSIDVTAEPLPDAIGISWTPYSDWDEISAYNIYRVDNYDNRETEFVAEVDGSVLSFLDQAISCSGEYAYRIEAVGTLSGALVSAWSDTSMSAFIKERPQDSLNVLSATVSNNNEIEIAWEWPTSTEGLRRLVLERNDGSGFRSIEEIDLVSNRTSYLDRGVAPDTRPYLYRIVGEDSCGNFTASGQIASSIHLKGEQGFNQVRLNWNPNLGSELTDLTYEIQVYDEASGAYTSLGNTNDSLTSFIDLNADREGQANCYRIIGLDANGFTRISNEVCIEMEPQLIVPSAFSPNNDGINDIFYISSQFTGEYQFQVFSKWGELIFASEDPEEGWDGTLPTGEQAQEGVYTFSLISRGYQNQLDEQKGTITLIR